MSDKYEVVIGLEIHSQLNTKSKMFCGCDNNAEGKEPNSVTCPVCMGMPGTLPVINKKALEWTFLLGLALGAKIADQFNFERKQYFYPDLPKGYQITSQTTPPLIGGHLDLEIDVDESRHPTSRNSLTIEHVHLEEDAGKLIHAGDHSLVDLNRAGTPLLEIVTNPDFRSPLEAKLFMQELQRILRYLGISSADMEKGHLRCDGNISLRPVGQKEFGKKVEIKNINSFSSLERALEFEIKRQTEMLDNGETIEQETRGWDDAKNITVSQRSKEMAHDYRYFPEPDLPPVVPVKAFDLENLKKQIPELPAQKRKKYVEEFGLGKTEADILVGDMGLANYFEESVDMVKTSEGSQNIIKRIANLILGDVLAYLNANNQNILNFKINEANLWDLATKLESGEISSKIGKEVFIAMAETGKSADEIISEKGIKQVSDTGELEKIVSEIIAANQGQVEQYRKDVEANGSSPMLNWFVGQAMKATKGQANPGVVMEVLKKLLG
ncbi:MAG: Asp-tRNA(Asn)/Glu-tRNA(Gln) amidotransferase subunit GatB [Patescibacteria group bacterium]|nr:Asp-tRNA(Asn)/Glu-tRNA(Gln) amidotransferase subunit GatB [Patescibacteria group bacterium]